MPALVRKMALASLKLHFLPYLVRGRQRACFSSSLKSEKLPSKLHRCSCLDSEAKHLMTLEVHECEWLSNIFRKPGSEGDILNKALTLSAEALLARCRWGSPFSVSVKSTRGLKCILLLVWMSLGGLGGRTFPWGREKINRIELQMFTSWLETKQERCSAENGVPFQEIYLFRLWF